MRAAFLAALFALPLAALDPSKSLTQYAHRVWGNEEGLFQPTVFSIAQTSDGFLWLGTEDSLIRFDGIHFRNFERDGFPLFDHALIHNLETDAQGNLWIASLGAGVAKLGRNGSLVRYTAASGLPTNSVFCASPDVGGAWFCTAQGLVRLDNDHLRTFTTADGLPGNRVRATCTAGGVRWAAGIDWGLARLTGNRFEAYRDAHIKPGENVTALYCASDGSVWAGMESGALRIRGGLSEKLTAGGGLADNSVTVIAEGPSGTIWIGSRDGISRYKDGEISVYRTRDGLSHSLVQSLFIDREGSLWAGTKDGLDQFTDSEVTPFTTHEGLPSNDAGPVIEDRSGRLWAGTLDSGLAWFDGRAFRTIRGGSLLDRTVLSLALDTSGDLWVGTEKGVNRLRNGQVIAAYDTHDGLSGASVRTLAVDANGTLWAGTNGGIDRFDGALFHTVSFEPPARSGVVALGAGRRVDLFASTGTPAFYLLQQGLWRPYRLDAAHPVDCYFSQLGERVLWMGTLGSGLLRWHDGKITPIRIKDGLYDNRIYSILADRKGNLWFGSSKGIFRIRERELNDFAEGRISAVTSIPFSTGQLRFECQAGVQPAAAITRDGHLWFSTTSGIVMIDPEHAPAARMAPPAAITAVLINGRRVDPLSSFRLGPSERNVEIRYAALSFVRPERMTFRYILDGYERRWTDAGTRREAFFMNLPPGHFTFRVMALGANGVWSRTPAAIAFTVEPRLYQRAWFFPALAVLLASGIAALYRMRIRRLRGEFNVLLLERTRIARELHDTLLQGLSGITMQMQALWTGLPESSEKRKLGEIIRDAAQCSAEARRSLWGLRREAAPSAGLGSKLSALAREAVSSSPPQLALRIQPFQATVPPEAEHQICCIVREAIWNALRYSEASQLQVSANVVWGELRVVVEDDGIGFIDSHARNGHFGISGMRERAMEIGAKFDIQSAPGAGTRVRLSLPLRGPAAAIGNLKRVLAHH
jgi:signal transduction histidine kinase